MPSPRSTAYLREDFAAHAVLHFGTHGALEFMPGKQSGMSASMLAGPPDSAICRMSICMPAIIRPKAQSPSAVPSATLDELI